ncbi:MAG: type I restriction endonuclease [Cyanobacteria bacterium P01_C01_bin.69]
MDLIDKLNELSGRIKQQKNSVLTEEAAKTAFVLPFLQSLGYDIFNPSEVIPEFTADHGIRKGEKVDYAIKQDGSITILIECKSVDAELGGNHAGQLFRYFSVTEARFSILTDGIRYLFFSDIDKPNQMDNRPFFEFNLLHFNDGQVDELKKFNKTSFDLETIVSNASNLKYRRGLLQEITSEFEHPSKDLVQMFAKRVYDGRITQSVLEQFTQLTHTALRDFIRDRVNERLKSAIDTDTSEADSQPDPEPRASSVEELSSVETTDEELEAYRIVQAIGAEVADPSRIAIRDNKSYCAILWDDNNRNPICRLHFLKTKLSVSVFAPSGEKRHDIEKVVNLYQLKQPIQAAICQYAS